MTTSTASPGTSAAPKGKRQQALSTAGKAVDSTRDTARDLARRTAEGIEANPLAALAGGVALGVLAGSFVPRSEQEEKLLAPVGKRLSETAHGAIDAAKEAGKSELDGLGFSRDAARGQVGKVIEGVLQAIATAGTAALAAKNAATKPAANAD